MPILIIIAKLVVLAVYVWTAWEILTIKKMDRGAKLEFDLLSTIEFAAGLGLALVSLAAVIDKTTYTFTLGLCLLSIVIGLAHHFRIILVGDKNVLFLGKVHAIRDIRKLGTGMVTLKICTKQKPSGYSIYVPLTTNRALKDRLQSKIS